MTIRTRPQLKSFFVKNAIPTEGNFADLIDSQLVQSEDGVYKQAGEPLAVVAVPGPQKRVLRLLADPAAQLPDWVVSLTPTQDPNAPASARPGLGITNAAGVPRLFLDLATGNAGLGTNNPGTNRLQVDGNTRVNGTLTVTGLVSANGGLTVTGDLKVTGTTSFGGASISGNTTFDAITAGSLKVTGATSLAAVTATNLAVTGNLTVPAGVATSDICVGRDDFGKLPWPYESIQVKAGRTLRLCSGAKETLTIDASGYTTIAEGLTVRGPLAAPAGLATLDISIGRADHGALTNAGESLQLRAGRTFRLCNGEKERLSVGPSGDLILRFNGGFWQFSANGSLTKYGYKNPNDENAGFVSVACLEPARWA